MSSSSPDRLSDTSAVFIDPQDDSIRREHRLIAKNVENVYEIRHGKSFVKVTFFPRNTIPHLQDTDQYPGYIFTPSQPYLREEDWRDFAYGLRENTVLAGDEYKPTDSPLQWHSLFYICAHPSSLITAAITLDPENPHLRSLREAFKKPIKPPSYSLFIDLVIAGKFLDKEGNLKSTPDFEGEILMLSGLLGDQQSARELIRRKAILEQISPAEKPQPAIEELQVTEESSLQLEDFVLVHATNYQPYADSDGVYLRSSFDGSEESLVRTSIHFSLNHHVVSHKQGHWEENPFIIVVPLTDTMALNGAPYSFRPEDTYYLLGPGNPLVLPPSAVLIHPEGIDLNNGLSSVQTVSYESETFSDEGLAYISANWHNLYESASRIKDADYREKSYNFLFRHDNLRSWVVWGTPQLYDSSEEFVQARLRFSQDGYENSQAQLLPVKAPSTRERIIARLKSVLNHFRSNSPSVRQEDGLDRLIRAQVPSLISQEALEEDYEAIRKSLQQSLSHINKQLTIERVLRGLGFRVQYTDPDYLAIEDFGGDTSKLPAHVTEILEFAESIGLPIVRHPKTDEGELDQDIFHMKAAVKEAHTTVHNPYENRSHLRHFQERARKKFMTSTPQVRRMVYLLGVYQLADYYL